MKRAWSSTALDAEVHSSLAGLAAECSETKDAWGNGFLWVVLKSSADLPAAAALLANHQGRLCTVTAINHKNPEDGPASVSYHFDVLGYTVTIKTPVEKNADGVPTVPTIKPSLANADWPEREFTELLGMHVEGNVNPKRLFLDPSIDTGPISDYLPLSIMMNGACTIDMWQRLMENKHKEWRERGAEENSQEGGE